MSFNEKVNIYSNKILYPFFFLTSFCIIFPVTSTHLYKKLLLFFFIFLMFIPVISFLRPELINYNAYYTIIITMSVFFFFVKEIKFKFDALFVFFIWYIFNGIFIRGIFNIKPYYSLFILPLTAISLYTIFVYQKFDYKYEIIYFFIKWLMIAVMIESLIGISQSFFSFPVFGNIVNDFDINALFVSNRNYLSYIFPSISPQVTHGSGTFSHFNGLGGLLSLTFPIFFGYWYSNKTKILRIIPLLITLLGLITTYSRGALFGVLFAFSFFFLILSELTKTKKLIIILFLTILIVVFLSNDIEKYYMSTENLTIRKETWEIVWNYSINAPFNLIFGYGIFFFRDNILGIGGLPKDIHSGQLEILVELGIVGFILFCKFYFQIILQTLRYRNNIIILSISAGLISFFIHQIVENSFFGYLGILMVCLMGILKALMKKDNEKIFKWWFGTN